VIELAVVVILVLGTAFFVAVEFALVAVDRTRVNRRAADGDRRAQRLAGLLRRLSFELSGAQLGITVTSVVLGFVAEPAVAELLPGSFGRGPRVVIALVLATVFQMVVGELVPKGVALARPEPTAFALTPWAAAYSTLFGPVIRVFNGAADWTTRRLGVEPAEELVAVRSLDELEYLIRSSGEGGTLNPESYSVLRRAMRFGAKTAADALVPRVDVAWLPVDATAEDLVATSLQTGHSRFPVCRNDLDDVAGVVHVKDVYRVPQSERATTPVSDLATEAFVVPETADLGDLLTRFRQKGSHLAVVVDEYGGTAGVLTLEDVLEELVGEIEDEYDPRPAPMSRVLPEGQYELPGTLHPDEVFEACGLRLPDGPYETLAGFVLSGLGAIPDVGDAFGHEGWVVEVAVMDRRRVALVRLVAPDDAEGPPEGAMP
jgi:CBS domain containing-hemolysin-like protein